MDPGKVTDILEYNRANAVMWKIYSIPYWLSGILACLGYFSEIGTYISVAGLGLACVPGLYLLVRQYHKIEKRFILR